MYTADMDTPLTTRREVVERLTAQRVAILGVGVRRLGLFGSFLSDNPRGDSDVDLLVEFEPSRKTYDNYFRLSELLERELRRSVDLLTTEGLSPYIGPRILAEVEYVALG